MCVENEGSTPSQFGPFRHKSPGSLRDEQFTSPAASKLDTDQVERIKNCPNIFRNFIWKFWVPIVHQQE
jgi:hypothetical protein